MSLFIGTNAPSKIFLGSSSVSSIFYGSTKIWPNKQPVLAYVTGGNTVTYYKGGFSATPVTVAFGASGCTSFDIAYGDGKFVIAGRTAAYKPALFTTTDFQNFTTAELSTTYFQPYMCRVAYGAGKFVAVNYGVEDETGINLVYSTNGTSWTKSTSFASHTSSIGTAHDSQLYYGNKFICGSFTSSAQMTSTDGINWPYQTSDLQIRKHTYGTMYVGAPIGGYTFRSNDCLTWTRTQKSTAPSFGALGAQIAMVYANGIYMVIYGNRGNDSIWTSPDGLNWTKKNTMSTSSMSNMTACYVFDKFFFGGTISTGYSSNTCYYTTDGSTVTALATVTGSGVRGCCAGEV